MRLKGVSFPEAIRIVAELSGIVTATGRSASRPPRPAAGKVASSPAKAASPQPERSSGLPLAEAMALVAEAAERLWTPEGAKALAYLHGRGLTDGTIRAARLGITPGVMIPTREGDRAWSVRGITIPWFDRDHLTLVKIRRPPGSEPKYIDAFRDRPRIYPTVDAIEPGRPLIAPEGEFDVLILGQELGDLAAVVTLGSASNRPSTEILARMLVAPVWYVAHDADKAGDLAAAGWPSRARRVRPPSPSKDWTEAAQAGVDLRRWWVDHLEGDKTPEPDDPVPCELADQPGGERSGGCLVDRAEKTGSQQAAILEGQCGATLAKPTPPLAYRPTLVSGSSEGTPAVPRSSRGDMEDIAAISALLWNGTSLAVLIEEGRQWNGVCLTNRHADKERSKTRRTRNAGCGTGLF
jgi:hypothetical protein